MRPRLYSIEVFHLIDTHTRTKVNLQEPMRGFDSTTRTASKGTEPRSRKASKRTQYRQRTTHKSEVHHTTEGRDHSTNESQAEKCIQRIRD